MKLLLQTDWEAENMTDVVKQAVRQFKWKGNKVEVQYSSLLGIRMMNKNEMVFFTPIGTVEFVKAFAEKVGIKLPAPIHATALLNLEGREYWEDYRKELISKTPGMYPVFVKPQSELKKFTGFVAKSDKDFDLYPEIDWSTTKLFCTQVLENIVSEWRCYVLNGKVFACVNYSGDPLRFPSSSDIVKMIIVHNTESFYSLDIAVCRKSGSTEFTTNFIEINDAFALGYYGGDVELYTKMLDLRWKEIIKTQ